MGKYEGSPPGVNVSPVETIELLEVDADNLGQANALQDLGVDLLNLKANPYDGKAIDPQYVPAKFAGTEPTAEIENAKTYYGGCHCGAVTVAMKTPGPLTDGKQPILECNCSICMRVGRFLSSLA